MELSFEKKLYMEMETEIMGLTEKQTLRQQMLCQRKELSKEEWSERSHQILEQYFRLPYYEKADVILAYLPAKGEPDLSELFSRCFAEGKQIAVPRVLTGIRDGAKMEFVFFSPKSRQTENQFQILEPEGEEGEGERFCYESLKEKQIELILPGLCFAQKGGRLGYGGGYYDRYFAEIYQKIHKTAFAFSFQVIEFLPCQTHDIPYDLLVTEQICYPTCGR